MATHQERNTANAKAFYDLMFNQSRPEEAVAKFVGDVYIQHNPEVGYGKKAFIVYFERMNAEYPDKKVSFKRTIAEDNLVVLHCHQQWPGDNDYAESTYFASIPTARSLSTGMYCKSYQQASRIQIRCFRRERKCSRNRGGNMTKGKRPAI